MVDGLDVGDGIIEVTEPGAHHQPQEIAFAEDVGPLPEDERFLHALAAGGENPLGGLFRQEGDDRVLRRWQPVPDAGELFGVAEPLAGLVDSRRRVGDGVAALQQIAEVVGDAELHRTVGHGDGEEGIVAADAVLEERTTAGAAAVVVDRQVVGVNVGDGHLDRFVKVGVAIEIGAPGTINRRAPGFDVDRRADVASQ